MEHLEKSEKKNSGEKIWLKNVLEDVNVNPRAGNVSEYLRKELKRMKVENGHEEVFVKAKEEYLLCKWGFEEPI